MLRNGEQLSGRRIVLSNLVQASQQQQYFQGTDVASLRRSVLPLSSVHHQARWWCRREYFPSAPISGMACRYSQLAGITEVHFLPSYLPSSCWKEEIEQMVRQHQFFFHLSLPYKFLCQISLFVETTLTSKSDCCRYVTKDELPNKYYLNYCVGMAMIFTGDLSGRLLRAAANERYFWVYLFSVFFFFCKFL